MLLSSIIFSQVSKNIQGVPKLMIMQLINIGQAVSLFKVGKYQCYFYPRLLLAKYIFWFQVYRLTLATLPGAIFFIMAAIYIFLAFLFLINLLVLLR